MWNECGDVDAVETSPTTNVKKYKNIFLKCLLYSHFSLGWFCENYNGNVAWVLTLN